MQTVWVVTEMLSSGHEFQISGVYSTADLAIAACKTDNHAAVSMIVDRDYSDETKFLVCSRANPAGVMTDSNAKT